MFCSFGANTAGHWAAETKNAESVKKKKKKHHEGGGKNNLILKGKAIKQTNISCVHRQKVKYTLALADDLITHTLEQPLKFL